MYNVRQVLLSDIGEIIKVCDRRHFQYHEYRWIDTNQLSLFFSNTLIKTIEESKLAKLLSRPQIKIDDILKINSANKALSVTEQEAIEQAEIQIKYNGYIAREEETAKKLEKLEGIQIPSEFNYGKLAAISSESREKLGKIQPKSIGQASRISGVSPSDINVLLVYMGR